MLKLYPDVFKSRKIEDITVELITLSDDPKRPILISLYAHFPKPESLNTRSAIINEYDGPNGQWLKQVR